MSWRKLGDGNIGRGLVSLERFVGRVFPLVASGKLGEITVVISHPGKSALNRGVRSHLVVEHLGLAAGGTWNEVFVEDLENVLADLGEFSLDFLTVGLDHGDLSLVALALLFLFNGGDDSPRCPTSTNDVLVGDREEVALLDGQFLVGRGDSLHVFDHFCPVSARRERTVLTFITLGLLSELGEVDGIFAIGHLDMGQDGDDAIGGGRDAQRCGVALTLRGENEL